MSEIHCEVTFHIDDNADAVNALMAKARELDEEESDPPERYTLPQAMQIVWHLEPEWLHQHFLKGWSLDRAALPDGVMEQIWRRAS